MARELARHRRRTSKYKQVNGIALEESKLHENNN